MSCHLGQRPLPLKVPQVPHHGRAGRLGRQPLELVDGQHGLAGRAVGRHADQRHVQLAGHWREPDNHLAGGRKGARVGGGQRRLHRALEILQGHPHLGAESLQGCERRLVHDL